LNAESLHEPHLRLLSLAHLRTLDHLLQLKNLSHAAERLGVSQSALSRQLAHLREAFDDPLLVRQGRGYVLSEHAEALVEPLRQVLEELHALRQPAAFDPARCERRSAWRLRTTWPSTCCRCWWRRWSAKRRRVAGVPHLAGRPVRLAGQRRNRPGTTLFDESPPNLHGRLLGEDRAVCLMRHDHPLAAQAALSQADYLAHKHVRISGGGDKDSFIDRHLRAQGLQRRVSLEVPFFSATVK
jgi:DNA-binding transcriptional LysR family regulator